MTDQRSPPLPLVAAKGDASLAGSLWLPERAPAALVVMHPGSGPSDRDNDVLFPPIRAALLDAGIAVASYDKRGVGESGGSWLDAGIEEQADDLLAGLAAAAAHVPAVPRGAFGHSQGGWVVLEATRTARPGAIDFAIMSSGAAVTMGEQERYAGSRALAASGMDEPTRARAAAAIDGVFALAERAAAHAELVQHLQAHRAELGPVMGDDVPDERMWEMLVRLAAFDPRPALRDLRVPLLAALGADDSVAPTPRTVEVLRETVDPTLLEVAVLPGAGHRMAALGQTDFVDGYPAVVVDFVLAQAR